MTTRLVLVEDHGLIAQTLAAALGDDGTEVRVIDPEAQEDLLAAVTAVAPDLVLLDLDLGTAGDSTALIEPLCDRDIDVLMVTGVEDPVRRARCLRAGALGVVDKGASFGQLLEAVRCALDGGPLMTDHERQEHLALLRQHEHDRQVQLEPFEALSPREQEVLGELVRGRTVDEIATADVVSVATVRTQVRAILHKLDVGSQLVAVAEARAAGWIPPQER